MGRDDIYLVRMSEVGCHCTSAVTTDLGHPYWIYIIPTHGMHQWLLLQFLVLLTAVATDLGHPYWIYIISTHGMHQWLLLQFLVHLMMEAESVRNMQSNLAVTNKQYCQSFIVLVLYIIYVIRVVVTAYESLLCLCVPCLRSHAVMY